MISPTLRSLFLLSVPLFIVHSIEEHWTEFFDVYPLFSAVGKLIGSSAEAPFIVFSFLWWIILLVAALFIIRGKWPLYLMFLPGLIYLYEFHHLIEAISRWGYYPGLITALPFPAIAFFFWREYFQSHSLFSKS